MNKKAFTLSDTKVLGNVALTYDAKAIADALGYIGSPNLGIPSIILWKEI